MTGILATRVPEIGADPFSAAFFEDPFPVHAAIRDAGPVVRLSQYDVLACGRHADVSAMLRDWRTLSSARGVGIQDYAHETPLRPPSIVLEADPPVHDRTRAAMNRALGVPVIKALREAFAAEADRMVRALATGRSFDAIAELAEAYPLSVFPDAVGIPRENRRHLLHYGNLVFNSFGPRNAFLDDAISRSQEALTWIYAQCRRAEVAPGGIAARIFEAADTGNLTEAEAEIVVRSVLTAGVDTTVSGVGAALYCLARFPDQFAALRAEPARARNAFEEAVRYETPVQTFFRTTTREAEIGGVAVEAGRKVLMFLGAANRDPRRWDNPDAYDITRPLAGHVGFGNGVHVCVGMVLARLEGECVLAALAQHVARIDLAGEPTRRYNNTLRGLASLKLVFTPA